MIAIESARREKLLENFESISGKAAAARTPRSAPAIEILAVTKYADPAEVGYLVESGKVLSAGENKVQDAVKKWRDGPLAELRSRVTLRFIGHLQTNKASDAVELFDWIDSVDSLKLAERINRHAGDRGKRVPVLIQLKLTDSGTQGGIDPASAPGLLEEMKKMSFLCPSGYMAIAPAGRDPEELRPLFREVKAMFDRDFPGETNACGFKNYLSLGMSGDFETAVQEGSNLPRIGSLLFS